MERGAVLIDAEEYEGWREHPTTVEVFKVLRELAENRKELWIAQSWDAGDPNREKLLMLRGQAEAFNWLPSATHEQIFGVKE